MIRTLQLGQFGRRLIQSAGGGSTTPYETIVAALAPTIWWKFHETSGTSIADSGSSGNAGTLTGGATMATQSLPALSGYLGIGKGVDLLNGATDDVRKTSLSGISDALGGNSSSSWTVVLVVCGGGSVAYLASRQNDFAIIHNFVLGKVEFFAIGYSGSDPRTGSQINLSDSDTTTPHQIAYRYDNGNWSGILDGVEVFNVTRSFGLTTSHNNLYVGSDSGSTVANRFFYDFQAYDRAVPTSDLAAMWAARNNV